MGISRRKRITATVCATTIVRVSGQGVRLCERVTGSNQPLYGASTCCVN